MPEPTPIANAVRAPARADANSNRRAPSPAAAAAQVSLEVFPAADEAGVARILDRLRELSHLDPQFVSVTYGAGGSTQARTMRVVATIADTLRLPVAAHLTCVGVPRAQIDSLLQHYADTGVKRIVALRGDPAEGASEFTPHPQGYCGSVELIDAIARRGGFDIAVGCYPERHPHAVSATSDIEHLKRKQDAGATRAISQFFFDADVFIRFVERARAAGITMPIIPGVLPVHNLAAVARMAARCGTDVPRDVHEQLGAVAGDAQRSAAVAVQLCVQMCERLLASGVDAFHFYTLNRSALTAAVCAGLSTRIGAIGQPERALQA